MACIRRDKRNIGYAMGNDLDLVIGYPIDPAQQFVSFVGHHDDLRGGLDDSLHYGALGRSGLGKHRMQRRHHRHGEPRQQFKDVGAGLATENSEFMLQAYYVEPTGVEEIRRVRVLVDVVVFDLQSDRRWIIIGLTVIGHRHDAGLARFGREVDIACRRSVVKVAMPQRRGSELPIAAIRRNGVMSVPR